MTWEEAQEHMNELEDSSPRRGFEGPRAKVRREAWPIGNYVYRGGWPLFHVKENRISYPGFAKVIHDSMLGVEICFRRDGWKPNKEDFVATDWILL